MPQSAIPRHLLYVSRSVEKYDSYFIKPYILANFLQTTGWLTSHGFVNSHLQTGLLDIFEAHEQHNIV